MSITEKLHFIGKVCIFLSLALYYYLNILILTWAAVNLGTNRLPECEWQNSAVSPVVLNSLYCVVPSLVLIGLFLIWLFTNDGQKFKFYWILLSGITSMMYFALVIIGFTGCYDSWYLASICFCLIIIIVSIINILIGIYRMRTPSYNHMLCC